MFPKTIPLMQPVFIG